MEKGHWTRREFFAGAAGLGFAVLCHSPSSTAKKPSKYHEKVLAKDPVAYWRLGEARGPIAIDSTENRHDGTFHGTPKLQVSGAISNDPDRAIELDGHGSFVEILNNKHFSQATSGKGLTVEAWVKPDKLVFDGETQDPYIHWLGKGDLGQLEWGFRFYSRKSTRPNRVSAYIWNPDGGLGAGAYFEDKLEPGQWIHVVACYDPGDRTDPKAGVSIFKNGVIRGGPHTSSGARYNSYDIRPVHGTAPVRLGTRDLKSFLTGSLDEVAIYPRVLSPEEILENYKAGALS